MKATKNLSRRRNGATRKKQQTTNVMAFRRKVRRSSNIGGRVKAGQPCLSLGDVAVGGEDGAQSWQEEQGQRHHDEKGGEVGEGRGEATAVEGGVHIEHVVVAQREQPGCPLQDGVHGHDGERHAADAERNHAPE